MVLVYIFRFRAGRSMYSFKKFYNLLSCHQVYFENYYNYFCRFLFYLFFCLSTVSKKPELSGCTWVFTGKRGQIKVVAFFIFLFHSYGRLRLQCEASLWQRGFCECLWLCECCFTLFQTMCWSCKSQDHFYCKKVNHTVCSALLFYQ